ncbi:hypothetical protein H6H02_20565 [Coleofasciculus sp. FACHB-1120]|nr:hypothetical protein [Coleofasciculus sp. FACHB-1120]
MGGRMRTDRLARGVSRASLFSCPKTCTRSLLVPAMLERLVACVTLSVSLSQLSLLLVSSAFT